MSANRFADTLGKLQQMKPWDVPLDPNVTNHIVTLYNSIHGEGGECFAERESRYINRMIVDDKNKWNVTSLSVFLAFVDLAVKDLTLEPGAQAVCYLLHRGTPITVPDASGKLSEVWETASTSQSPDTARYSSASVPDKYATATPQPSFTKATSSPIASAMAASMSPTASTSPTTWRIP